MPLEGDYLSACMASYVVLQDASGKVFLMRRTNTNWCNGYYNVPAGKVARHETFLEAAIREAKEEAGIDIEPNDLELFLVQSRYEGQADKRPDWVDLFFVTKKWNGAPRIAEPHMSDHAEWFAPDDVSVPVIPNIRDALTYLDKPRPAFALFAGAQS
jgi:8-oxo-dGTP diphosphatase